MVYLPTHVAEESTRTKPKLLDKVREAIRTRHYSRQTEEVYVEIMRNCLLGSTLVQRAIYSHSIFTF